MPFLFFHVASSSIFIFAMKSGVKDLHNKERICQLTTEEIEIDKWSWHDNYWKTYLIN